MADHNGVQIGTVLANRYRVERVLGRGGMGIVVRAMHLQLHQPVALKFLLPDVLRSSQIVERFLREAQAAVRLRSEHVARVLDVGSLETGAPYIVLEYLEGADLASFPRSHLTTGGIIDLVLQACEALAEAHTLGIVHRDIKPGNLFITRRADGTPLLKVLDFGISKTPRRHEQLTASQTIVGTPTYMSPEQMHSSRDVDHRSDIWSLGVVLYELFQGTPPYVCDTFSSMVLKVAHDSLPKLTVRLPGGLDAIIYRCLEKNPAKRFQNLAELARALSKYAQSATQATISVQRASGVLGAVMPWPALEPPAPHRAQLSTISGSASARTIRLRGKQRWRIVAITGALLGGLVIVSSGHRLGSAPRSHVTPRDGAQSDDSAQRYAVTTSTTTPPAGGTSTPQARAPVAGRASSPSAVPKSDATATTLPGAAPATNRSNTQDAGTRSDERPSAASPDSKAVTTPHTSGNPSPRKQRNPQSPSPKSEAPPARPSSGDDLIFKKRE